MAKEYLYFGSINDYELDPSEYDALEDDAPSAEDIAMIRTIKTGSDIKTVVTGNMWKDDHESCINVTINGAKFSCMWIVPEFLADVIYAGKGDNEEAKDSLASYIHEVIAHQ